MGSCTVCCSMTMFNLLQQEAFGGIHNFERIIFGRIHLVKFTFWLDVFGGIHILVGYIWWDSHFGRMYLVGFTFW